MGGGHAGLLAKSFGPLRYHGDSAGGWVGQAIVDRARCAARALSTGGSTGARGRRDTASATLGHPASIAARDRSLAPQFHARTLAAAHRGRHPVHPHPGLHDRDAPGAAVHAALRHQRRAVRPAGVGLHAVGRRLGPARRHLCRPLRPPHAAAVALWPVRPGHAGLRPGPGLRLPHGRAHRRRCVRRRAVGAGADHRGRRGALRAAGPRHGHRHVRVLVFHGGRGAAGPVAGRLGGLARQRSGAAWSRRWPSATTGALLRCRRS